uniref:Uncharacterized protein n=1 Tax=Tanacetum cinerariifolium TaxID=118510 RepID=A0A6L2NR51_TANCI|nr:hypothetical protein [Tanacetum cinerariifolium]
MMEMLYKSFQDRYQYEDNVDPEKVRYVWEERAKRRFRDGILAPWMTEKWKKRSAAAAGVANRKIVPWDEEGSYVRHTGGCVSFEIHCTRWASFLKSCTKRTKGVDDIASIPFDDEAWAEATYFTKNNKGFGFRIIKQAQRIYRKAKRSALKRSSAYIARISDEARIELEVTTRLESRMKAFKIDMKQRVEEQVQEQIKIFLAELQI